MKTKGNWVIKTSTGLYWCGANMFDEQIRKAQIYHWKEKAEEQAAWIWKRNKISEDVTWEVIAVVEPKELKDTEAEWQVSAINGLSKINNLGCVNKVLVNWNLRNSPLDNNTICLSNKGSIPKSW